MPSNRKRRSRNLRPAIEPIEIYFLQHGTVEGGPVHDDFELFLRTEDEWKKIWIEQRDKIMESWIRKRPCTRPWGFWQHDVKEPRQRIGGIGIPGYEFLSIVPHFVKGIPTGWVSKSQEDYYNGRQVDIHGHKIGTYNEGDFLGKAIDPGDPPTFESQGGYLQRHSLLTDAEKKFLEKNPGLLDPERITMME